MNEKKNKIITRFPPSPTGSLHIGNVRTALFNYFFARQQGGEFIVRVEDTDQERSKKEYEDEMFESLKWLGIRRDREGELWRQSERTEIYKSYLNKLIENGHAYISQESEGKNREVVRFKNPNKKIIFEDLVRGTVEFDTTELEDFIIARNINDPVYHLAVVVDDFESGVTHVIRGEDHISNTPRQILIQEAIGAPRPVYAHIPLILASDRSKLSKRKHGEAVSLKYYRDKGYLPQAVINYLALLGWNPGTDQEIFTMEELIKQFDFSKVQKGGAILDEKKLEWINRQHINLLPDEEKLNLIRKDYDTTLPPLDSLKISWKNTPKEETLAHLIHVSDIIGDKDAVMKYAEEVGKGNVLWPLRYALSGKEKSPDPFTLVSILGEEESLKRVKMAIDILKQ